MAKKRKNAVPKRIAGMKVPKRLRKGRVGELLSSPVGQVLIFETVARAGERLVGRRTRPGSAERRGAVRSQEAVSDLGENASESSAAVVYALRQAARAFVAAMQEQQAAGRVGAAHEEARDGEKVEKKEQGERPDRRTAH